LSWPKELSVFPPPQIIIIVSCWKFIGSDSEYTGERLFAAFGF